MKRDGDSFGRIGSCQECDSEWQTLYFGDDEAEALRLFQELG